VIGALLCGAYSYMRSGSNSNSQEETKSISSNENITVEDIIKEAEKESNAEEGAHALLSMLSGNDINNIVLYDKYGDLYNDQVSYNNNAVDFVKSLSGSFSFNNLIASNIFIGCMVLSLMIRFS